ncbi:hypothetical protein FLAN108750_11305 [Flavobacterium antarcticum]
MGFVGGLFRNSTNESIEFEACYCSSDDIDTRL